GSGAIGHSQNLVTWPCFVEKGGEGNHRRSSVRISCIQYSEPGLDLLFNVLLGESHPFGDRRIANVGDFVLCQRITRLHRKIARRLVKGYPVKVGQRKIGMLAEQVGNRTDNM